MTQLISTDDKTADCVENQTDTTQDEKKNRDFMFDLTYKFYENQIKRNDQINTITGFALATNGVVFLGVISFCQLVGASQSMFRFLVLNTLVLAISILSFMACIVCSNPIFLDLTDISTQTANRTFKDLHNQIYANLESVIKFNDRHYRIAMILWVIGVGLLAFSMGIISGAILHMAIS